MADAKAALCQDKELPEQRHNLNSQGRSLGYKPDAKHRLIIP